MGGIRICHEEGYRYQDLGMMNGLDTRRPGPRNEEKVRIVSF